MAVRACHRAGVPEIRVGVVRLPVPVAPVLELRADAVPVVDLDHRAGAGPEAAVAAFHRRMCVQLLVRGLVARLLAGGGLVLSERSPCRGVEVHAARMQVDVGRRIVPVYDLSLRRVERHRAVDAVLAAFFERDADDASRRVGIVVGARGGHDLYFLNLLGPELHAHRLFHGGESEVLNQERVFAGSCFQRETSFGVGGHAGHLFGSFQQDDRCVFDGFSLFVHHAARRGAEMRRKEPGRGRCERYDKEDQSFHNILFCTLFVSAKICNNIYTMQDIVL